MRSLDKAVLTAGFADDRKAEDIMVLDLQGICSFTDFFVICTGQSHVQLKAIGEAIIEGLRKTGARPPTGIEGDARQSWYVLDLGDVVVHIMSREARDYYRLENLWGDGQEIDWAQTRPAAAARN